MLLSHVNFCPIMYSGNEALRNSESIFILSQGYLSHSICLRSVNIEIILDFSTVAQSHKYIQMKNALIFLNNANICTEFLIVLSFK